MSGDYTKNTIGSALPCSHQVINCIKLDSLINHEGRFKNKDNYCCYLIVGSSVYWNASQFHSGHT